MSFETHHICLSLYLIIFTLILAATMHSRNNQIDSFLNW